MSYGFSVYFGLDNTAEENIELLKKAHDLGFTRIFTSLHIPEANYDVLKKEVKEFLCIAKEYNMDVISDISPNTFKFLGLENMDLLGLKQLGVQTIRIDFGYTEEEIAQMSRNSFGIKVQFNASTVTKEFFNKLDEYSPDYSNMDALHNFYPRIGTGISQECLMEKNAMLEQRGIGICAFVQSNYRKRSPLKDGLPTMEDHRDSDVRVAANHLYALGVEDVFIGDSLPSDKELKDLSELKNNVIEIRIITKTNDTTSLRLLQQEYTSRPDNARDAVRAAESRLILKGETIEAENNVERNFGDVTIDNVGYMRYMGELQILLRDCIQDNRINVVAKVVEEDYKLLPYIKDGRGFRMKVLNII